MIVTVVASDKCRGCFGVYSTDEKAYEAIKKAYGSTVERINKADRYVKMTDGEILVLYARKLDLQ